MKGSAGWQWSMIVAGLFVLVTALLIYAFLVPSPDELKEKSIVSTSENDHELAVPLNDKDDDDEEEDSDKAIGLLGALRIPGVVPYVVFERENHSHLSLKRQENSKLRKL